MRRLLLCLFTSIFVVQASAQSTAQTPKDSVFKKIAETVVPDTVAMPVVDMQFYNQNLTYKLRLDSVQKVVPLSYNEYVQSFIDKYTKRKEWVAKMLGLSNYYFPIFENALKTFQIPEEIKYLPIIESEMNPHAISRVGATGMWQFMFGTAKAYGLTMDNFVDERKDPIQASYAAAAYFRDAYEEFGDWLLAIAAYNCGKGNVARAIAKAGSRDFWEIRTFLPKETRDYVPAFIAAVYVMKYHKSHHIMALPAPLNLKTDTLQVTNFVSFADLAQAINYDEKVLLGLNPSYKKKIVNGTPTHPQRIILPQIESAYYAELYNVLTNDFAADKNVVLASTDDIRELRKRILVNKPTVAKIKTHKVGPGQNLSSIAKMNNVEVQDLKVWNNLKTNTVITGQQLKIYPSEVLSKPTFVNYKVKLGDTLSAIAEKFDGVTVSSIKKINRLASAILQPGMILKIKG